MNVLRNWEERESVKSSGEKKKITFSSNRIALAESTTTVHDSKMGKMGRHPITKSPEINLQVPRSAKSALLIKKSNFQKGLEIIWFRSGL